jgi:pyruvate/2-oxoglutarate/acetoin dehydrogenase E1 component
VKEAVAAGYDPEVIDLISLKPFDQSAITVRGANNATSAAIMS